MRSPCLRLAAVTAAVVTAAALAVPVSAAAAQPGAAGPQPGAAGPQPGAAGLGDRLYPTLGNGGYDVLHYDVALRYATSAPTQAVDGTVTLTATATQALSRFDLDFSGASLRSVAVNGRAAAWKRVGEELVVTPGRALRKGQRFTVTVSHFTAAPTAVDPNQFLSTVFFVTPDGSAISGQPNGTHLVLPSNDHPRDKAGFSFRIDVPAGTTAVANGVLTGRTTEHGRTVWRYEQRQPMATELLQVAVGDFVVVPRGTHDGVQVRDVVPRRLLSQYRTLLGVEVSQLDWMTDRVGRYPFASYGTLPVEAPLGFALETQTLSLFDSTFFTEEPRGVWDPVMLHELAHQWFGDDVAPYAWSDVWLNEGHATWYEYTYAAQKGFLADDAGIADFTALMRDRYRQGDQYRAAFGPVGLPLSGDVNDLFNPNVYDGGALVLYALRQRIGDAAFRRLERAWVRVYSGRSASTADFVALASKVSGQDQRAFLTAWIYGTKTPPMPGHPNWTVDPVVSSSAAGVRGARASDALGRFVRR